MSRTAMAALLVFVLLDAGVAMEFRPRPDEATLSDGERTYPRVGVETNWRPRYSADGRRYVIDGHSVIEVAGVDGTAPRSASVGEDYRLEWIGAAEGVAFLVANLDPGKFDWENPKPLRQFHRLDLDAMKWLEPFELPEPSIDPDRGMVVHFGADSTDPPERSVEPECLLVTPEGVLTLFRETRERREFEHAPFEVVGYHVCCYLPRSVEAKWSRAIRHLARTERKTGFDMRSYDDSISQLTYVTFPGNPGMILVCPGETEPMVCLSPKDGKVFWRLPAIWEYERGFIGPSVFEHYIERFGLEDPCVQLATGPLFRDDEKVNAKELRERTRNKIAAHRKLTAARKTFYERYEGRMSAGPIVVANPNDHGDPKVYVAAVRSLKPERGGATQPEYAFIYELELYPDGVDFAGMTRLPRPVIGRPCHAMPDGLVLSCDRGCLVRLRTYQTDVSGGFMGPGAAADDLLLQIDWYRELLMLCPSAWFNADPPDDVAAFSQARMFRPGRAYVRRKEDKVYQLLIQVVDLRTGSDRHLTLSVPFDGDLPIPETRISSFNRGMASEQFTTDSSHPIQANELHMDGNRLTIVTGQEPDRVGVTFDLSALLADEAKLGGD